MHVVEQVLREKEPYVESLNASNKKLTKPLLQRTSETPFIIPMLRFHLFVGTFVFLFGILANYSLFVVLFRWRVSGKDFLRLRVRLFFLINVCIDFLGYSAF